MSYQTFAPHGRVSSEGFEPYFELVVAVEGASGKSTETALLIHPSNGVLPIGSRWEFATVGDRDSVRRTSECWRVGMPP